MKSVFVENKTALNTSDHVPVVGTLKTDPKSRTKQKTKLVCKPKWEMFNRTLYWNTGTT